METPATLLPDYLKEKKMPAMSVEMRNTLTALQQEQREIEWRTGEGGCDNDPDLSTPSTVKDLKNLGEGSQKSKQDNRKLKKSMSMSDEGTRKEWNTVTQNGSSLPKIPATISRTVTLSKMDRVAPVDRTNKKTTLPKLVSVSPTTESLLLRNKLLDKDIKSMRGRRNDQTRRPSNNPTSFLTDKQKLETDKQKEGGGNSTSTYNFHTKDNG